MNQSFGLRRSSVRLPDKFTYNDDRFNLPVICDEWENTTSLDQCSEFGLDDIKFITEIHQETPEESLKSRYYNF